jgi:hypothetical protein
MELLVKSKLFGIVTIVLLLSGCTSNSDGIEPQPTKTVYVPVPQPGLQSNSQENIESDLADIRDSNCRLANDLYLQHIDLDREASSLENQARTFEYGSEAYRRLIEQASNLKDQSINLLFKSARLRENC